MKKLLLAAMLMLSVYGFSQPITVSTTSHSVPQLVNNVLINSPCVSASNITWRTGSNYGSLQGLGYFQNTNPNFPMDSGVVLSTGNAISAQGPNNSMLGEGAAAWPGDADLENTLAQAGITMVSTNATVLEFDFMPISSHFNFDFVFASEEYGNFQCQFSDAFAFLLTNMSTGVTTNLAVVPNTTTPISVVTIRDFLYNSSCPSVNSQYFGSFNGGSAAAGSATNFNGQTVLLNASSVLTPNTPYHIKLVIADRSDAQSDSAIFISSDSFNIGQDVLGLDMTVASNTAVCYGDTFNLSTGLDPAQYTFVWTKNGVTISGATGPSINVTQPGTYGVTYTNTVNICQPVTDDIKIEYYPQIVTPAPKTLYKCNTGAASYTFDLSQNTPVVSAGATPVPQVSYFASISDANNNINPLPLNYSSPGGQTVYVKIKNPNTSCFVVKPFQLLLAVPPVATQLADLNLCARSQVQHNAGVSIPTLTVLALNGQPAAINIVSFYTSQADADTRTNPIIANSYTVTNGVRIYIRVENVSDHSCYSTSNFQIFVNDLPLVDTMEDLIVCDNYVLPPLTNGNYFTGLNGTGTPLFAGDVITQTQTVYIFNQPSGPPSCSAGSSFKVTIIKPEELSPTGGTYCGSYALPTLEYGDYHTAPGGGGSIIPVGTALTSSQVVYVYFITPNPPFCVIDTDFNLTIIPVPEVGSFADVFDCVSYTLPPLSTGNYFTQPLGQGSQIAPGTVITSSQTVYVHAEGTGSQVCGDDAHFNVIIGFPTPADINQCDPYALPQLPIGRYYTGPNGSGTEIPAGTLISTPTTVYIFIPNNNNPNCVLNLHYQVNISQPPVDTLSDVTTCNSYILPALVHGNYYTQPGGTGTMLNAGDAITTDQTVYIYAQTGANCSNQSSFAVTISPLPAIDSRSDIDICNSYVLTALNFGNYYTGPGGTGTMLPAGTVITQTQTIYIYAVTNSPTPCSIENSFDINIFSIEADAPADVTRCDSYTLPPLTIGNYYTQPGGAASGEGNLMHAGDVITTSTTLYIYTESGERINCTDENVFHITITPSPVVPPVTNKTACNSYTLPALTVGNYYTATGGTGTQLHAGDVLTSSQTVYVYAQTNTTPNCTDEKSFTVTIFNVDELADVTTCESYVLPALTAGKYYTGPGGTGTLLNAGSSVTVSKTIYVYGTSPFAPSCTDESSFEVTIIDTPVAHTVPVAMTTVCDEDGTNDGITSFDLTQLNATVLGNQSGPEFSITYYESMADATTGTNPVTSSSMVTVFVKVSNSLAPHCFDVKPITIRVNMLPVPTPVDGIMCFNTHTNTLISPYTITSGLSASSHTFQWIDEAGTVVGTGANYVAVTPGIYTLTATKTATGCVSEPVSVQVSPSEPALVSYSITEDFADSQSVTVIADGTGDYEYQLDYGVFQDSPVFENVSSGIHIITVNDKNHCGISTTNALVVNYPHYFTPNGDGINDTWNIKDLRQQVNAKITVFDRYGKIVSIIRPSDRGWDGTLQGAALPSTDYWFVVDYDEDGVTKEFKAHFAMKR